MRFHAIFIPEKLNETGARGMSDEDLLLLRGSAIELIEECEDIDLLDLLCKLLIAQKPIVARDYTIKPNTKQDR